MLHILRMPQTKITVYIAFSIWVEFTLIDNKWISESLFHFVDCLVLCAPWLKPIPVWLVLWAIFQILIQAINILTHPTFPPPHLSISLSLYLYIAISPSLHLPNFPSIHLSVSPSLHLSVSSSRGRSPGRSRCSNRPASSTPSPWRWPPWALGCLSTAPSGWPRESSWNRRRTDASPQRRHAAECGELGGLPQNHDGLGCFH